MPLRFSPQLSGIIAIIMWSFSALLVTYTGSVPAFLLATLSFGIAFLLTLLKWIICKDRPTEYFKLSFKTYLLGILGIGGYLTLYYLGFKFAPPIEANLLNYMWPIMLVIFSSLLLRQKLKAHHFIGILMSFIGCIFVITKDTTLSFNALYLPGYCAAFLAAITWGLYSTLTHRFPFKAETIAVFCLFSSFITLCFHLSFEATLWPENFVEWGAVFLLGLSCMAYMLWDYAMKHGKICTLASLSYFIPIFSTLLLVLFNRSPFYTNLLWGAALIISGSLISNLPKIKESLSYKKKG
ncbi:MAG: DMT family transporter [Alphaproteobacteria bacterium]